MKKNMLFPVLLMTISFLLTGPCPQAETFFPKAVPAGAALVVVDLSDSDMDTKLTATTLQGLVNRREEAELYLLLAEWDVYWLRYLETEELITGYTRISFEDALQRYAENVNKVFFYDPELPASINIATMMAAIDGGIVVSPDTALEDWAGSTERLDLRGRWTSNVEAYRWALETLLPEMNPGVLACYHPTACNHHIRDYLVQHKVFHFWATAESDPDAPHADPEAERKVVEEILAATAVNIPVLGFWYSGADRGLDEYVGVGLAGEYGKITVVCDWATNLSLLGGVSVALDAAVSAYFRRVDAEPPPLVPDKVYLAIDIVESGDSPSYVQTRMHTIWADDNRGSLPINWSLGPAILDLAPPLAYYYYSKATSKDYLYMSISGAGYCQPYRALFTKTPSPGTAWERYMTLTRRYCDRMQSHTVGLYTDAWKTFDRNKQDAVTQRFAEGLPNAEALILGMGRDEGVSPAQANYYLETEASPLVSHIMTRWPTNYGAMTREENIAWLVDDIRNHTPETRPAFIHVMALSWVFGPSEIRDVLDRLGDTYVPLTVPQYTALYQQWEATG